MKAGTECCLKYINHNELPPTAEALMRSRFTAFATREYRYIFNSWHPQYRPTMMQLVNPRPRETWTRLTIIAKENGLADDTTGIVEFEAQYSLDGKPGVHRERSTFTRIGKQWLYVKAL
jgi:SEC-C motif-containing protein